MRSADEAHDVEEDPEPRERQQGEGEDSDHPRRRAGFVAGDGRKWSVLAVSTRDVAFRPLDLPRRNGTGACDGERRERPESDPTQQAAAIDDGGFHPSPFQAVGVAACAGGADFTKQLLGLGDEEKYHFTEQLAIALDAS